MPKTTKKKQSRQINVSVYIATDPKDPKVELLDLTCKALDMSNSELFRKFFISYLIDQGLLDKNENPVQTKIDELKEAVAKLAAKLPAPNMPKLFKQAVQT